ncbi:hypothetical protein BH20VER2_BH20VER2_06460 [soil metagenome]
MWNFENPAMTGWVQLALGVLLLLLGRKLFWVFVGAIGFVVGVQIARYFFGGQSELVLLLIALGIGLVGALLAILLQRLAVAIAGWVAGGYLALRLAAQLDLQPESLRWIAFFVGAILAAILFSMLFDWALIILSAITGAVLIAEALPLAREAAWIVAAVLCVLGALVQLRGFRRSAPPP